MANDKHSRGTRRGRGDKHYEPARRVPGHASTDEPVVVHEATPYDLPSARDLYTQIPDRTEKLTRFGSDVFIHRRSSGVANGMTSRDSALDVPLGPDYVLGPGDKLTIRLWGGTTQSIARTVDRMTTDGSLRRTPIPKIGAALGFMMYRSDSEFLVNYIRWRMVNPVAK